MTGHISNESHWVIHLIIDFSEKSLVLNMELFLEFVTNRLAILLEEY